MALRLSIRGAERAPQQIGLIRDAFARIKQQPDDRGYDFFASIHGLPQPIWCEHGSPLFLPWHRAYLYFFELALQTRLQQRLTPGNARDVRFAEVGIPWWDWTSPDSHASGIPDSFAQPQLPDGTENVLAASSVGSGDAPLSSGVWSSDLMQRWRASSQGSVTPRGEPRTLRNPGAPTDLPTAATIANIVMRQTTFADFSRSLEQVHNQVHVWVGGSMGQVPIAAYDPIFWTHHAMIDRIWYLWQSSPAGRNPPDDLLDRVLAPFPMTVRQTLDIRRLGYDYAVSASS